MPFIASVEVDQRQNFIQQADTLREMIGASRMIEYSIEMAREAVGKHGGVRLFWPVSGVLRFYSQEIGPLGAFLAQYCALLEEVSLSASVGVVQRVHDFDTDLRELDRRVRRRKDAKTAALPLPTLPYFAPCSILPHLPANFWNPSRPQNRQLQSWQARKREDFQSRFWNKQVSDLRIPYAELPALEQLAPQESDSYLALLKGDVDGLGRLLADMSFEKLAKEPELKAILPRDLPPPEAAACCFCEALEGVVRESIRTAYEIVHPASLRKQGEPWPFRHLIVAGDDVLILSRRNVALNLAYLIGENFARKAEEHPVLRAALGSAGIDEQPTISFGVLFVKVSYPFDASFDLAESLLHSAKARKKSSLQATSEVGGYLDFYWLGDSARPNLQEIRKSQQFYRDDSGEPMWLTTRPWGLSVLDSHIAAARILARLPRRKIKQLDEIARLGKDLSALAFQGWWGRLLDEEKKVLKNAASRIGWEEKNGRPVFWRQVTVEDELRNETCFPDLVQLTEVMQ